MAVDTLKLYERLRKATSQDETAKELAEIFKETNEELLTNLATKEELKKEIKELELILRKDIADAKTSTIIWVAGMLFAQTGIIVGILLKFLPK